MATTQDISSLFGGTVLPQDMQQELINQRAQQFATLTPSQQLGMMGYKTGAALGGGLAQAMGVDITDPRIKRQAMLQQLSQGVENTSEGLQAFAQKLSAAGFTAEAAQAMDKAREIAKTEADTGLKKAQATKAENFQQAQADKTQVRNLLADVETRLGNNEPVSQAELNKAKLAYQEKGQPVDHFDPTTQTIVRIPGIDMSIYPNLTQAFGKAGMAATGGPKIASTIETKASIANTEKEISSIEGSISNIDDSLNAIKGIRDVRTGSISTNPWLVNYTKNLPTGAKVQDNLLRTITAGKVIDTIMEMKQQSKTGATGFGALNGRELDQLEAKARTLDPASPAFETDLKYIEDKLASNKTKLQNSLTKKQPAQSSQTGNTNWQNPQGNEGRIAILNAELSKATNPADIAGLKREIASLGGTPTLKLESNQSFESKVLKTLKASGLEDNPKNRAAAIKALNKEGHN